MTSLILLCAMAQATPLDTLIGAEEVTDSYLFGPPISDVRTENQVDSTTSTVQAKTLMTWDDLAASIDEAPETGAKTPTASINTVTPLVMMPLGIGLLAGAWFLRRKVMAQVSGIHRTETLTIVSNKSLGNHGNIVVLDVLDLDGTPRRLVVGAGQGSPSLVADISAPATMFFTEQEALEDSPIESQDYLAMESLPTQPTMAPMSNGTDINPIQKRAAQDLVDELLAERQGYGRTLRGSRVNVTA